MTTLLQLGVTTKEKMAPFFSIEESYHQAKHFIRENDIVFHCCLQPHAFILHAFVQISPENCEGYFRNSGYE